MGKSVSFTGHRPEALPWQDDEYCKACLHLKDRLRYVVSELIENGADTFYVGMARGIDTYVAEILLEMRDKYLYDIKIIAVIPCKSFADKWSEKDRARFYDILSSVDEEKVISKEYTKGAIFVRNKYMVDNSDILVAVYANTKNGGTYNTLSYARSIGKRVIIEEI